MRLEFPISDEVSEAVQAFIRDAVERSFRVVRLEFAQNKLEIELEDEVATERVMEVIGNILYVSRSINRKVVFENRVDRANLGDPLKALLDCRDVIRTADGMFSFQGKFWKIFKTLQAYVANVAESHGAIEQEYPVLWPVDLYKKINYFKEFPHQVILGTPLESDFQIRDQFAKRYSKDQPYTSIDMDSGFAGATYGLQCAVCDTCYYNLRDTRDHPNTLYTTYNKVFRNELSPTSSLDRLLTFSVRDIMFVGDRDFVLLYRQRMLDEAAKLLQLLDLDSKIETANDPFFSNDAVVKNIFQSASELKYELLVRLHHSESYLAVGSVNLHLDFFGQAFDIRSPGGTPVFSGCIGIGFERLVYSIYCQFGTCIDEWPSPLKRFLSL